MMLTDAFQTLRRVQRKEGARVAVVRVLQKLLGVPGEITAGREAVNQHLSKLYGHTVAHGVFKDMRLSKEQWWGGSYLASKLLGTYEQHIAEHLERLAEPDGVLIDIGAADGYFAVGCLRRGFFARAVCFEIAAAGRQKILENAKQNTVSEDKITVHGAADRDQIRSIAAEIPRGVILCDIEGAEFDLLDTDLLQACQHLHIIVELHDWSADRADRAQLVKRAEAFFTVETLRSGAVAPEMFPELFGFRDDYRMLAFSEGRGEMGDWLLMSPRSA